MDAIEDAAQLRVAVLDRYDALSPRLKQIAQFMLDDPHSMGVETLAVISDRLGVPPSTIVRFAKSFGFDGAGPMQRLLKDGLLASQPESAYYRRAREFSHGDNGKSAKPTPFQLLNEFVSASNLALDHLGETISEAEFTQALDLIGNADTVHVVGFRRSFPVASYLAYSLQQGGKRTTLIDGIGGLSLQQGRQTRPGDLLIAVSFAPYAQETVDLIEAASARGAEIVAITDSVVNAVAKSATSILHIRDTEVRGFRTLAASMCLAQALAIAHAFRDQPDN